MFLSNGEFSMENLCPKKTIAEMFGLTERRVEQLVKEGIIKKAEKGLFDLVPTVRAYTGYLRLSKRGESSNSPTLNQRLLQAQAEEREAKARIAELDLSVIQGRLHEAAHVKKIMTDMIVSCRSKILAIPSKASPVIVNVRDQAEVSAYLRGLVYEALESLAEYDPEKFNELNEKYIPSCDEENIDASKKKND
jgi:phage terminase Nu1 subunit (DNA packaging protein)